jgi:hypothetical protein
VEIGELWRRRIRLDYRAFPYGITDGDTNGMWFNGVELTRARWAARQISGR